MIVVFCLPQFVPENFLLQPWLTIHQVAIKLSNKGHDVHIITDEEIPNMHIEFQMHNVKTFRGTNSKQIEKLLHTIKPDSVIVTITPLSLATAAWYKILEEFPAAYGYISYPFYSVKQIFKAMPYLCWKFRWSYGRHLLVPKLAWAGRLVRFFKGVICQSKYTAKKIEVLTKSKIITHVIPPGIDTKLWEKENQQKSVPPNPYFLYLGTASRIRGFFLLLKAIAMLPDPDIKLKVLARGADETTVKELRRAVEQYNIVERISIHGGWIRPDELQKQIRLATAVLFPFILVPSELPVSVLEAIYCGTPVIVSDLVGLPEVVGNAGIVVPHADARKMASAIQTLHQHKEYQAKLNQLCCERRNSIMSWDSVCKLWADFITQ